MISLATKGYINNDGMALATKGIIYIYEYVTTYIHSFCYITPNVESFCKITHE